MAMLGRHPRPFTPLQEKRGSAYIKFRSHLDTWSYRKSRGWIGGRRPGGQPVLLLTTTGRKSGQVRTVPVLYLKQGDVYVVVASKGGMSHDPLWFKNLEANPRVEIEVGCAKIAMTARRATAEEKTVLWPKLLAMYPSYAAYQARTQRDIPVVLLMPRSVVGMQHGDSLDSHGPQQPARFSRFTARKVLSRLAMALVGICIGLLWAEAGVRFYDPHARDQILPPGLLETDADLGWRLVPGGEGIHHSRYFNVTYKINALGLRDGPRTIVKHLGTDRILLYGDSVIFGWGIPMDERVSNRLQSADREIWNLAVPGYGLDQEILYYRRDGRTLSADEVVFFVSSATLERLGSSFVYKKYKPMFFLDGSGSLTLKPPPRAAVSAWDILHRLLDRFYLPYFLERRFASSTNLIPTVHELGDLPKKLLLEARSLALQADERMIVLSDLPPDATDEMRDFCNKNDIGFLDIDLGEDFGPLRFGSEDPHWNLQAQAAIAAQLGGQLGKYLPEWHRASQTQRHSDPRSRGS